MLSSVHHSAMRRALSSYKKWAAERGTKNIHRCNLDPFLEREGVLSLFNKVKLSNVGNIDACRLLWKNKFCPCCTEYLVSEKHKYLLCLRCTDTKRGRQFAEQNKQEQFQATCQERYGYANPFSSPEIKQKIKDYWQQSHGIDNPSSLPEITAKKLATYRRAHGNVAYGQSYVSRRRRAATVRARYGVSHVWLDPVIKNKALLSSSQSGRRFKPVTLGRATYHCQGYEDFVLPKLFNRYGNDVLSHTMEKQAGIVHPYDALPVGYHKNYFPDFYVKSIDTYVEVKGTYTLLKGHNCDQLKLNRKKSRWAYANDVCLVFVVCLPRKNLCKALPRDWHTWHIRKLKAFLTKHGFTG